MYGFILVSSTIVVISLTKEDKSFSSKGCAIFAKISKNSKEGINYCDGLQNLGTKDKNEIRNNVYLIKHDCGNVCHTSYESEQRLHKGNEIFYLIRIYRI